MGGSSDFVEIFRLNGPHDPEWSLGAGQDQPTRYIEFADKYWYHKVTGAKVIVTCTAKNSNDTALAEYGFFTSRNAYTGTPSTDQSLWNVPFLVKGKVYQPQNGKLTSRRVKYYDMMKYNPDPPVFAGALGAPVGWIPTKSTPANSFLLNLVGRHQNCDYSVSPVVRPAISVDFQIVIYYYVTFWLPRDTNPLSGNFTTQTGTTSVYDPETDTLPVDTTAGQPSPP